MKHFAIKAVVVVFSLWVLFSCDILDTDDPPSPEVELEQLMPYTQYLVAYWAGTDHGRFPLQWMQQLGGVRGTYLQVDRYSLQPELLNPIWYLYYHYINENLMVLSEHAIQANAKAYLGITRILKAYSLGMMTDAWGDIPYKAYPVYDEQQFLIFSIFELLDQGIQDLEAAAQGDGIKPGAEQDPFYGGNLDQWKRAANMIRIRYLLRTANVSDNFHNLAPYFDSNQLLSGNHDNMVFHFPGGDRVNPHYYFDNLYNHTRVGKFLVALLKDTEDPRLPVYVRTSLHEYVGTGPGEAILTASNIGNAFNQIESPVLLVSYAEQKFIEAEVHFRLGNQGRADQAFAEAVISSLLYHGVPDPEWEAEHASVENVTLEQIITAKYTALFLNPEVWSDYRRTGYPALQPYGVDEDPEAEIPRRFVYPADELFYNPDNVPEDVDVFTRMWWDVE